MVPLLVNAAWKLVMPALASATALAASALRAEIQKGFDSGPAEEIEPGKWIEQIKARGRQQLASRKRGE